MISYQGLIQSQEGVPIGDSTYPTSVSIWADSSGGTELWRDVFQTSVKSGIFNIMLGSQTPLPSSAQMDKPLWLSVNVGGSSEVVPRSRLSAVPMALNVADSSITSSKMATDYISGVTIDGTKITSRGDALNLSSEGGVQFRFDSSSNSVSANIPLAPIANGDHGSDWSETGNNSTTPGTNYIGTSDSLALEIHVNDTGDTMAGNGRVMRYEPMPKSPNIIGGYRGNTVTSYDGGNVIAGGGWSALPNKVSGPFSTIGGGAGNTAINGGTIAGGGPNGAGEDGFVGGGGYNYAGQLAVSGGGLYDSAIGYGSVVGGGGLNKAINTLSTIAGGTSNAANGEYSSIGGGISNFTSDSASTVAGGFFNGAKFEGAVGGGYWNRADTLSAIPGGTGLTLNKNSFGFNASGEATVFDTNVAFFGNVDLWLTNLDNKAGQLRFYGPNTLDDYGTASGYTSLQYNGGTIIKYILPAGPGGVNQVLTNDGTQQLYWGPAGGTGEWLTIGNFGTSAPGNFLGTRDSNSLELHIFDTGSYSYGNGRVMRYEVNDTSANILGGYNHNAIIPLDTSLHKHIVGVVIAGGGANGHLNIVKGSYAVISGGRENTDTAYAFVGGGDSNRAMGAYSAVVSGKNNLNGSNTSVIAGGELDTIDAPKTSAPIDHNVIAGGLGNRIHLEPANDHPTQFSAIAGGFHNGTHEYASFVGGGAYNYVDEEYSSILGGQNNTVEGLNAVISGGEQNQILFTANLTVIAGGGYNTIGNSVLYSSIGGGTHNTITYSSVGSPEAASIPGGQYLIDSSYAQTVVGEYNIPQGNSGRLSATTVLRNPNDRMFIVGGGHDSSFVRDDTIPVDTVIRFNPFEVSRNGHSIVYHTNGTGGATPPPPGPPPPPPSGVIYGARYQDNTCYAWGDAKGINDELPNPCLGQMQVFSDFGVDSIVYVCLGHYRVYLNTVDPYTGSPVVFGHGFSVTATSVIIAPGIPNTIVQVTQLGWGGIPGNAFDIYLVTPIPTAIDGEVMFHVFGRQ